MFGSLVAGVIAPFIKHRLESGVSERERKRQQVVKWREMVLELHRQAEGDLSPGELIQVHPEFISLEPHLSDAARKMARGENREWVVGQALSRPLETLKSEISRIESEWGLRD